MIEVSTPSYTITLTADDEGPVQASIDLFPLSVFDDDLSIETDELQHACQFWEAASSAIDVEFRLETPPGQINVGPALCALMTISCRRQIIRYLVGSRLLEDDPVAAAERLSQSYFDVDQPFPTNSDDALEERLFAVGNELFDRLKFRWNLRVALHHIL